MNRRRSPLKVLLPPARLALVASIGSSCTLGTALNASPHSANLIDLLIVKLPGARRLDRVISTLISIFGVTARVTKGERFEQYGQSNLLVGTLPLPTCACLLGLEVSAKDSAWNS